MKIGKWILAGSIGGAVSAGIWTAIAYSTGYEIGWIAWLVGVVVGFCVRMAAGDDEGYGPGITAVGIAVLALLVGKYATVSLLVDKHFQEKMGAVTQINSSHFQVTLCSEVVQEWTTAKKKLTWPPGKTAELAEGINDYPQAVRDEAQKRWAAKPVAEQQALIAERQQSVDEAMGGLRSMLKTAAFKSSFNGYDILFFFLAIASAFKMGSGMQSDES